MKPLFGGFFRIAPLAQTIDDGRVLGMVADGRRTIMGKEEIEHKPRMLN